eukprot:CAMPEP_0119298846 /NCGR_PEP_ID=MMETSP1333-20130426/970_1 /TAXON_ID=418940 /ORGANISM="Scyphosphaera apsteinii, Strain RCC1455" /LENGTH=67 /DNA_ID=CAMNT_0007300055 /DNA_START=126 /DNA_END=326 /DNA_ORIENTATION=+
MTKQEFLAAQRNIDASELSDEEYGNLPQTEAELVEVFEQLAIDGEIVIDPKTGKIAGVNEETETRAW